MTRKVKPRTTRNSKRFKVADEEKEHNDEQNDVEMTDVVPVEPPPSTPHGTGTGVGLTDVPVEVLISIACYFEPKDLSNFGCTCSRIYNVLKENDRPYRGLTIENIFHKSHEKRGHAPYSGFRELCVGLYRHRWLREGVWHGDREDFGSLSVSAYNIKNGALELYFVAIQRRPAKEVFQVQTKNGNQIILAYKPLQLDLRLDLQLGPLVSLNAKTELHEDWSVTTIKRDPLLKITVMKCVPTVFKDDDISSYWWPPIKVPAADRTRNISSRNFRNHYKSSLPPFQSQSLIRVKRGPVEDLDHVIPAGFGSKSAVEGVYYGRSRLDSLIEILSRLLDNLLSPDKENGLPYQGLWVADCGTAGDDKFLLIHSPRKGGLEGVLLTGSGPKLPRGTRAFSVDDMTKPSEGAPEVDCEFRIIVAAKSYLNSNDQWIDTHLAILNDNEMINYDPKNERANYYYRVDVEDLFKLVEAIE